MTRCAACGLYRIKPQDRFCGLCGAMLPELVVEDGGQVSVPSSAKGTVKAWVGVRNAGCADLMLHVEQPQRCVTVCSPRTVTLHAFGPETRIELMIDADALKKMPGKRVSVPLGWDLPASGPAPLLVLIEDRDEIQLRITGPSDAVRIPILPDAPAWARPTAFSVSVENQGTARLALSLAPNQINDLELWLAGGETIYLNAYESASLQMLAASRTPTDTEQSHSVVVNVDAVGGAARSAESFDLRVQPYVPARPLVGKLEFAPVAPRENRTAHLVVQNEGSEEFCITRMEADCDYLRVLTELPVAVPPYGSTSIECYFSTRLGPPISPRSSVWLRGSLLLVTEGLARGRLTAQWSAQVCALPEQEQEGILGIDFGTVNSCVAYLDPAQGEPQILALGDNGEQIVPSMLAFLGPDLYVIGQRAARAARESPEMAVHSIKRYLDSGERSFYGHSYTPLKLASMLIEQLLLRTRRVTGLYPSRLAMTVPSSFWGARRNALIAACREVWSRPLEICDEPTSAAFYHVCTDDLEALNEDRTTRVLVFDFGGGTLDISIVEITGVTGGRRTVQPIIARGESYLGGIDLDLATLKGVSRLAKAEKEAFFREAVAEGRVEFERRNLADHVRMALQAHRHRWIETARQTKERLSSDDRCIFFMPELLDQNAGSLGSWEAEISRESFVGHIQDKLDVSQQLVLATVDAVGLEIGDIDAVLMAGQSCRIPAVQEALAAMFGPERVYGANQKDQLGLKSSVACGAVLASYYSNMAQAGGFAAWRLEQLLVSSYRYGVLFFGADGKWHFEESIGVGCPLGEPGREVLLAGGSFVEIAQYAGQDNTFLDWRCQPGLVRLGSVAIAPTAVNNRERVRLALSFRGDEGRLVALLNGRKAPIEFRTELSLERAYL